jgi:hypothetical protein
MKKCLHLAFLLSVTSTLLACNSGELNLQTPNGDPSNPVWPNQPNPVGTNNTTPEDIDPGRVTIRRLNRAEYNNTIRDLFGDTTQPANTFPEDDYGYGFNNNSDVLSLSLIHMEQYHAAIEGIIERALDKGAPPATTVRHEAEVVTGSVGGVSGEFWNLYSNGTISQVVTFPATGNYIVRARAYQTAGGPDAANMVLRVGTASQNFAVANLSGNPGVFEFNTRIQAGAQEVVVEFTNDFYDPDVPADRNLYVDWFEVEGPTDAAGNPSPARAEIMTCDPADNAQACAAEIIAGMGLRAWRRPLTEEEVTRLTGFLDVAAAEGDDFEVGIKLALRAMLMSPNFLFRPELDPDHENAEPRRLTDWEMASRLSYFIWSSTPDKTLLDLAAAGQLQDEEVLKAQVERMVADPKSEALINTFATQWLYMDAVLDASPNYETFPDFDPELRAAMREETRHFVKDLIDSNAPITTLLTADFTYVNERLARHYGIPGVTGEAFVKTEYGDESRRGIIGHAGLLTARSHPTMTSPVRRGEWILANLWCDEPPPPPPNVENIAQSPEDREGKTIRELFEQHSTDPICASCHRVMDPIGFGLEHYDGIGAWRETDSGKAIDASGVLPGDLAFNGPLELSQILASSPKLLECSSEKMLTFALGRGMKRTDKPQIDALAEAASSDDFGFQDLITHIVLSDAFRMRRGGEF